VKVSRISFYILIGLVGKKRVNLMTGAVIKRIHGSDQGSIYRTHWTEVTYSTIWKLERIVGRHKVSL